MAVGDARDLTCRLDLAGCPPGSLLQSAWRLTQDGGFSLPEAVSVVSRKPARAVGLADRGEIAAGLRGDVIRVKVLGDHPVMREGWLRGRRVV